jgi:hypothetical protein
MKGYFSRLIEQTGITSTFTYPVRPPTVSGDVPAPIHVDQRRSIEPQKGDAGERSLESRERSIPVPFIEEGDERNSAERTPDSEVPEAPNRRPSEREQSEPPKERAPIVRDPDRSPSRRNESESSDELIGLDRNLPSANEGALEGYVPIEPAAFRENEHSAEQALPPKPDEESRGQAKNIWQGTLQEVREWVTETPVANEMEVEGKGATRDTRSSDSPLVERERIAASYSGPNVLSPREEPETRDLHLEIGTISVTVEEPQGETKSRNSSKHVPAAEKKPARGSERSRLSRYYIRSG